VAAAAPAIEKPKATDKVITSKSAVDTAHQEQWQHVLDLQCELTVDLVMPDFKIGDLLKLRQGSVINAHYRMGRDVPLCLNSTLLGWIEFELVGERLAVRLTELA
jgi:flagellar motor switch/type III secretory pathway protein FliN